MRVPANTQLNGIVMQWSKRKKKVEEFFTDAVSGRVELRSTHYGNAYE